MASTSQQQCSVIDNTFGPYAEGCRGGLDFTLLFEETILGILPLVVTLIASTIRLMFLRKTRIKVIPSRLQALKLVTYAAFAALQLALLVLWSNPAANRTNATTTAISLSLIGAIVLCALSYSEHRRSVRPSLLLNGYLLFSLIFDVSHTRTLWLRGYDVPLCVVSTVATVIKLVILLLEMVEKRRILRTGYGEYPPEATSGIINKSFFWWLNPLLRKGYSKTLAVDDLFTLDKKLVSENVHDSLHTAWHKVTKKSTHSLLFTTLSSLKLVLLSAVVPRLCLTAFNFCQPFLINAAISVSQQPVTRQSKNSGYGLIGAYILVYTGIAVSTGQFQHLTYRTITMVRGGLIAMLYSKTADLSASAIDPSSSVILMSADIERITTGWETIHEMWANIIEIGLAIFLLYRQLGVACTIPVAVAIFSMMGSITASGLVMSRQAAWLEAIERRITATTTMLGAMKGVKMCGLTDILFKIVQDLRVDELRISRKFRKILMWNMVFSFSTPVAAPILTFTVFTILARNRGNGETLDTARVFTSLSLFTLLSEPLGSLIMALANFMASVGSFHRIQEFLDTDIRVDNRTISNPFIDLLTSSKASGYLADNSQLTLRGEAPPDYPSATADSVVVRDGSFGWDKDKEPILRSIHFTIPREKFTMLVGPVGCGKSTLIKVILGEASCIGGTVQVSSPEIAFCDQTAWHINGPVQQSIIGISQMDDIWYKSVIQACALEEDLKQLPRGDQTLIGSGGIALSGGQSQRIALARAVYARKNIIILDDILRTLDADTENQVFHNLLGQRGLLRKDHSTVLIASSAATRLPYSDHIIVLNSEGMISEQGSFAELSASGGYVSTFNLPPPDWNNGPNEILPSMDVSRKYVEMEEKYEAIDVNAEVTEDDTSRRMGDTSVYLYYIKSVGWLATLIFVVFICGFVVCFSLPAIWVKWWSEANILAPNQNMSYYLGIYGLIGALALICLIVSGWQMIITMVPRSGENFHWILLKTVLSSPMSFFSSTDTGVTLNRFSQDLQLIDMDLPLAALNTFATFLLCIAQLVIIGVSSVYVSIAFPIILGALYFIQRFYLRTSRQLRFLDLEAKSPLYSQFLECLSGLATIRAFGWSKALEQKNLKSLDQSQRPFYQLFAVQRWLTLVLDLLVAAIAILLIVLVVTLQGTISAGFVGVALLNLILFGQSIKLLLTFWTNLETHIGSIARIKTFTTGAATEDLPSENQMPPQAWPARGSIEFKSVSAAYKPSELVLKDISLSIEAGQKIGICGRTGSGKSSLVLTLFRMIELSNGSITIDGVDISTMPRQELRSRLNGVPQDAYFLSGSVRLNADPRSSVPDTAIIEALKSVQLWNIIKEKGGLNTNIEKIFLSHGQKQLFCLARAMLRKSTILVLDEATNSVDSRTEELMQRIIRVKFFSHTIIAVGHRLDTILDFDKVALIDRGVLVEFDSPHSLLCQPSSAFYKLYHSGQAQPDDIGVNEIQSSTN